jgi:hypothetical protein
VHIPKVAGTSVKSIFESESAESLGRGEMPFKPNDDKFDPPPPHLRATDHLKYGLVTASEFNSYFKFAFVRNPWERMVSEYLFRGHPLRFDFKTFLFEHLPKPAWSDEYCHIIPQYDFVHDEEGHLIVDFIGHFETLSEDFATVRDRIGLPVRAMPHLNRHTSHLTYADRNTLQRTFELLRRLRNHVSRRRRRNTYRNYREYYDAESREFVGELYQKDVTAFGYSFG